jgi:hypothetical protein
VTKDKITKSDLVRIAQALGLRIFLDEPVDRLLTRVLNAAQRLRRDVDLLSAQRSRP